MALSLTAATISRPQQDERLAGFYKVNGRNWVVRWSADGQRVVSLVGGGTRVYEGKGADAARRFLSEWSRLFGVQPQLEDMQVVRERETPGGASVEFQQMVAGRPVDNGRVQVNLDKRGRVLMVENSYLPVPHPPPAPTLAREKALELALDEFLAISAKERTRMGQRQAEKQPPVSRSEMQLDGTPQIDEVFFARVNGVVSAYRIEIRAKKPFGIRQFIIDARTGEVLRVRERVKTVDGTGQVFIPNPNVSLNDNTINHTNVPNTNPNPYYTVPLLNLDPASGGVFHLTGPFVTLEDIESPSNTPATEASADAFTYTIGGTNFCDVMLYYHIDRIQRYIQSLGFVTVNNRQIRADSRGLSDGENAHYAPDGSGTGYLAFGRSHGHYIAEDAEAIVHEYGHAIQDNAKPGGYDDPAGEAGAMGEGFGDYLAVSDFDAEAAAAGADPACFAVWALEEGHCLRRVDSGKTTDDEVGEVHDDGEIWSQALWNLFLNVGKATTDRDVLQSHFNVPDLPSFKQGADAVLTADLQLYAGSHLPQLCQEFINRKIYTAADCPTIPGATGTQSTLVVLARFNDAGLPASPIGAADVTNRIDSINNYLSAVTFGQASLGTPTTVGWLNLPHSRAEYYDQTTSNLLIQLAQDVIAAAPGSTDFTTVDRMIIITNDDGSGSETRGLKEWATTGPWPYTLPAAFGTRRMSVSVHRFDHDDAHFNHAMGHHFGLGDLYPHEGVTFPRKYANGWSNMAQTADATSFPNTHVFAWEKGRPAWMTGANVQFVQRPAPGGSFDQTFNVFREEENGSSPIAIQVGTTNGVTTRASERVSYYIEARKRSADAFDGHLPQDGVVIYYVNEDIGQGFGPARIVDATPGDDDLTNSAWQIGSTTTNIDGSGLVVSVLAPTGAEDYRVRVQYNPPSDQVDVWINPHDASWKSPDIWIDSPGCNSGTCGFDKDAPRTEVDRGDEPIAGQVNRAYARIYNHGPGTAHDVRVDFYFSDPYHGIDGGDTDPDTGGNVAFNKHQFVVIPDLPPTDTGVPVFVDWTPEQPPDQDHPHACIKVKIQQVTGDTNPANQASQENIDSYDISSHSPYPPVVDSFRVVNPYPHALLVFLRADNVPVGWTATIWPQKAYLPVGGSVDAAMTIQAPTTYPVCSTELITATAWYPSGDTLVQLGGSTAQVNLTKSTTLTATSSYVPCDRRTKESSHVAAHVDRCGIAVKGCTNPPRPFEHITVRYTAPDGTTVYHDVVTDANGCYEDFYVAPQGGPWNVDVTYQGDNCTSTTHTPPSGVFVPPDGTGSGLPGGPFQFSLHLGMNFPAGSFRKGYAAGPSITLDLERRYSDSYALTALLGFHYFHGSGLPNLSYTSFNLDLKRYFPIGALTGFAEIGPGLYRTGGTSSWGANAGIGLHFPIQPTLALEASADLHVLNASSGRTTFFDVRLGMQWKF